MARMTLKTSIEDGKFVFKFRGDNGQTLDWKITSTALAALIQHLQRGHAEILAAEKERRAALN